MTNIPHPMIQWWTTESRWADSTSRKPEDGQSEGRLAIDAWNAALDSALRCVVKDGNPEVAREKIQRLKYQA